MRWRQVGWGIGGLAALAALGLVAAPVAMRARADNPIWRGMRLARGHGCFNCHAAPHGVELANPGSPFGSVPSYAGANLMMYVEHAAEVEEWIRDGYPRSLRAKPAEWARYRSQLLQMPAFGALLAEDEIAALAAYVVAADGFAVPDEGPARAGWEIARNHCLGCHNVGGAGGLPNPASPFGYVPALWGPDHRDLVRDVAELREWIETGSSARVAGWPLATWFWRRQRLRMPAYGEHLSDGQVEALVAYVRWLGETEGGTRAARGSAGAAGGP
jgi:mono/diheme cytochrome c family protein